MQFKFQFLNITTGETKTLDAWLKSYYCSIENDYVYQLFDNNNKEFAESDININKAIENGCWNDSVKELGWKDICRFRPVLVEKP